MNQVYLQGKNGKLGSLIFVELNKQGYQITEDLFQATIIIDVSSPLGTEELLNKLLEKEYYPTVLVGTTGHKNFNKFDEYGENGKIFYMSNFSQGIRMIKNMIEKMVTHYQLDDYTIRIEEIHHINKKDKPSGTAISIKEVFENDLIEIISHRVEDVFGDHLIILENENERIEIKHVAKNRELFAKGCVDFILDIKSYFKTFYII
jgi:4-hydroxy-tetrahydrodipicolinate reductase